MKQTHDYTIFNKHLSNRKIVEHNVKALMESISRENLLHLSPILVDEHYNVMDGQHRLEAAKRLKIPVFYEMDKNLTASSIFLLNNNQLKWGSDDYLDHYCSLQNNHYIKLKRFMEKNKLPLSTSLCLICNGRGGSKTKTFQGGQFIYPDFDGELELLEKVGHLRRVTEYMDNKILGNKKYILGPHFARALVIFLNVKQVDFELFMRKLPYRLDLVRPCSRVKDLVAILRDIYNYKNKDPLRNADFEEMEEICK